MALRVTFAGHVGIEVDGVAVDLAPLKDFSGRMFYAVLGLTVGLRGDHEAGRGLIADALRDVRETRNVFTLACGMTCLAFLERAAGDLDAAAAAAQEATEVWQAMGLRGWLAPHALALLAWAEMRRDNVQRSVDLLKEGLQAAAGPPAAAWVLLTQGLVARHCGDAAEAEDLARRCLGEVGPDSIVAPDALELLAGALADLGAHSDAARILGSATAVRNAQMLPRWAADEPDYWADLALVREISATKPSPGPGKRARRCPPRTPSRRSRDSRRTRYRGDRRGL